MQRKMPGRIAASAILAAGTLTAMTAPATADTTSVSQEQSPQYASTMMQAMQRDLGLSRAQAEQRLDAEAAARQAADGMADKLGESFGGFHYDAGLGKLVVGVTDRAEFGSVRAKGAVPRLVDDSRAQLREASTTLNQHSQRAPESVTGWYVDTTSNSVVLTTRKGTAGSAAEFVRSTGVDSDAVRVVESAERPRTYADVIGGQRYVINNSTVCSVGFAVSGGFVSAGHCGDYGDSTSSPSGTFAGSSFPGNDYSYVRTGSDDTLRPWVDQYNGSARTVSGSQEAAVGSSVCRSGQTTGWHCGTIQAKNQTVSYPSGTVYGMTRTDVCAEPGDSGGSFISGNQAQGMTSGGSGDCTWGGTTYFQPVNEALNAYGVSLVTS
ncbi:streptogrisin C [Actinopolyspora xinjiangensis]|uniref:Streptogrisin C n=1 Tax=Actinopolyspora xinjiangensis TaxID=405564 RepID=A0A1H0WSX8_9ACTN|nr:S1 family peptidase [Actinopolyspora xinjiangensis]SDP93783.1 streptogrisin C [Actinopolyspora xinjiangensis]